MLPRDGAEFEGYACQLVVEKSWYEKGMGNGFFGPGGRAYTDSMVDREGCFVNSQVYIEVVEK